MQISNDDHQTKLGKDSNVNPSSVHLIATAMMFPRPIVVLLTFTLTLSLSFGCPVGGVVGEWTPSLASPGTVVGTLLVHVERIDKVINRRMEK